MKNFLYTIYDRAAEEAGPVFQAKTDAVANRQFIQLLANVPYKGEYKLLKVGSFDSETCMLHTMDPAEVYIVDATEQPDLKAVN